jgi:hypothetical protein
VVFVVSRAGLVATSTPWQLGVPRHLDEAPLDFCLPSGRRRSVHHVPFQLRLPDALVFRNGIGCLEIRLGGRDGGSPRHQERVPRDDGGIYSINNARKSHDLVVAKTGRIDAHGSEAIVLSVTQVLCGGMGARP